MEPDHQWVMNAPLVVLSLLIAYILGTAVYAITLHPLADIPGPKLCAISRAPYWNKYFRGRDVSWLFDLHQRYGPVIRFGPNDLSYATVEAWKDIHSGGKQRVDLEKPWDANIRPVNGVESMLTSSHEDHVRLRKVFSPAFSERALRKQEPMIKKYVGLLMSKLRDLSAEGQPVEMTRILNFTTFDVMADLCFGHPLGLLAKNEFSPWVRSIFESLKMLPFMMIIQYYPVLQALYKRIEPEWIMEQRLLHCKHSGDRVDQRLQEGSDQPDIWNLVMAAQGTEQGLSLKEMHSNAELFMMAGSETTATLLGGATYYLLTNPDKLRHLREEIRCSFRTAEEINLDSLTSLKYLNACLKEALRVYPPVPIGSPRVIPVGGHEVLGRWIPAGTYVSCHHWSMNRSPWNFTDPDRFVPERWLGDPKYAADVSDAHQPFAYGPRNCIGQNVAMHEMRLILATLLWNFDLELCEGQDDWPDQQTYALWIKKPLICRVRPTAM